MKSSIKFKRVFGVLFLAVAVTMSGCKKDDDDDMGNNSGSDGDFLTAMIDGVAWEASTSPATIIGATLENGVLAIQGGDNDGNTIAIRIFNYQGPNQTYEFGGLNGNMGLMQYLELPAESWIANFAGGAGSVTVTSDNGNVFEGDFNFDGFNANDSSTKNISSGRFKATMN